MISAIEDDDPVIFFEPKRLYNGPFDGDHKKAALKWDTHPKGEVPEDYYSIPLGEASIEREGSQGYCIVLWNNGSRSPRSCRIEWNRCRSY